MTLTKTLAITSALLAVAAAPPAGDSAPKPAPLPAQPVPATAINCLLAANFSARMVTDPVGKDLAKQAAYFYLGRLNPRITAPQLKSELNRAAETLKGVSGAPLMNACLQELRAKGQMLQSVAQDLKQSK